MKYFYDLKKLADDSKENNSLMKKICYENNYIHIQIYDKSSTELNISLNEYLPSFKLEERNKDLFTIATSYIDEPSSDIIYSKNCEFKMDDEIRKILDNEIFEKSFHLEQLVLVLINGK